MSDDKVRLLICHTCHSIQELPWYEGTPEHDDTLKFRLADHRFPDGREHMGVMATAPKDHWDKPAHRDQIVAKIQEAAGVPGSGEGLGDTFYDVKSNFQHDAMACWKKHNRTHDCGDWRTDRMRLYPDTKAERKAEGLPSTRPSTFLCDFCPVTSLKMQNKRHEEGYY